MSSLFKIFQDHYVDLIECLPMDNVVFIGELFKNGLLPNDLKAMVNSTKTSKEKAAKFLDNVIEPGLRADDSSETSGELDIQFRSLLSVMKDSEYENVKKLADTIVSKLDPERSILSSHGLGK